MSSAWASLFGFPPSSSREVKHEPARQRAAATRFSIKTHSPKFPQQLQAPSVVISRRGINGLGFSVGFLQLLFREDYLFMQSREIAMAEEPPCILTKTPSGLAYCDRVVGTGAKATKGELIKAHYIGKLENGIVFDSSYKYGRPLVFRVGVGEVIKGWDQGILGGDGIPPMFSGGKRTLKLPPQLGYGMRGAGCKGGSCVIPPDSVLVFDVEFVGKA